MRRIILLISLMLLLPAWLIAHDMSRLRVEGCLYGEPGNLVLMDDQGNTFALTGQTYRLNYHIGHRVRVE